MDMTLAALLNFYIFSTGRRLYAMMQVRKAAAAAGFDALVSHCDVAIAHDRQAHDIEARWLGQRPEGQYSPEARQIDIVVDATLTALRDGIDAAARTSAPGDALGEAAVKLGKELFPTNVVDIITLSYVEELAEVNRILGRLQSVDWAQVVEALGLSRHAARLADLAQQYSAAIEASPGGKVSFGEVKDARGRGQALMLKAVAMILGRHPSDEPADLAGRAALLGPIMKQNEAIRGYLRARRAVQDVNPETGEVEPEAGGSAPAQGTSNPQAG